MLNMVVSSPKEPKYLDPSYETDLGFGDFFGLEIPILKHSCALLS